MTHALQGKMSGDAPLITLQGSSRMEIRNVPLSVTPFISTSYEQKQLYEENRNMGNIERGLGMVWSQGL